jgi:hypothetical protein
MLTRTELLDELHRLTPAQRRITLAMARTIRAAREAGDTRPAEVIVAHLVQPGRRVTLH